MDYVIDLRSDTVTQPTQAMRDAMLHARVGDDCYGDDPSVNELEDLAASVLGKEAALFVTSGTQGNAVCIMSQTRRGESLLMDADCHISVHENGSYGLLSGVSPVYWRSRAGIPDIGSVKSLLQDHSDIHLSPTGLVCMENAFSNGNVIPLEVMSAVYHAAKQKGLPVHLDGARIFNAALYLGVDVKEMTQYCDTVMCCLSKGLCAPVGSIVAGPRNVIETARRFRKILGGGLRQAGILAAAGKIALTEMTSRLQEDHENAFYLATQLAKLPGVTVDLDAVKINMIFYSVSWNDTITAALPGKLLEQGIKIGGYSHGAFRMVTNKDVSREDCDTVIAAMKRILQEHRLS